MCFRQAVDVARHQAAHGWELRAATSLGRLLGRQGKRDEARQTLADVYAWFTEGLDTADLREAKAILEELAQPGGAILEALKALGHAGP